MAFRPHRAAIEGIAHGVLPPLAAFDDHDRLLAPAQIGRRRCSHGRRQRNDDVGDRVGTDERVDAVLEDRTAPERRQLLRLIRPEAQATPTGSDDGSDV